MCVRDSLCVCMVESVCLLCVCVNAIMLCGVLHVWQFKPSPPSGVRLITAPPAIHHYVSLLCLSTSYFKQGWWLWHDGTGANANPHRKHLSFRKISSLTMTGTIHSKPLVLHIQCIQPGQRALCFSCKYSNIKRLCYFSGRVSIVRLRLSETFTA